MKRILPLAAATVALLVGAATGALAHPRDPATREAARACLDQARQAHPDADRRELREAAKPCLEAAGIDVREPTPEQRARREALRDCARDARQAHPDDEEARRQQVRGCMSAAGFQPPEPTPEQRARRDAFRECARKVRSEHPDAGRHELRHLVHDACRPPGS
jgi:TRAP-type C4-dicarboxylate transport system substrate-binding protein